MQNRFEYRLHGIVLLMLSMSALVLPGCRGSRLLLDTETVAKITSTPGDAHRIIYFDRTFTYTPSGSLLEKTYQIVRVGENTGSFPARLEVYDESNRKLVAVEGRVTHRSRSTETFSTGDFFSFNLSNRLIIAEVFSKRARIREKLTPGDLIETVTLHENILSPLGIVFSMDELEYPAENVTCSIDIGPTDSLVYRVVNSTIVPVFHDSISVRRFSFHWDSYKVSPRRRNLMEKRNQSPQILATRFPQSWQSFGDWYLKMAGPNLEAGKALADTARSITAGKSTPKEKMDAIFEYCQRAIRYERVYFGLGEIIPTAVDAVFARKYGDCKDYASLMHAMAASVGVTSQLVLCHRGRGVEFIDDTPVSQFNHAILHFEDGGRDYWYDGTNRAGLPGLTTFDLANARALVLEKGNSRLVTIEESPANSLVVTGSLTPREDGGLNGNLVVTFSHQYAIEFFWLASHTNREEMRDNVYLTLRKILNDNIIVDSVTWTTEGRAFTIAASCELPNSVATLQEHSYVSVARVLPNLLPGDTEDLKQREIFYFPYYNRVLIDLRFTLSGPGHAVEVPPTRLELRYQLPAGPFSDSNREGFCVELESVMRRYRQIYRIAELATP